MGRLFALCACAIFCSSATPCHAQTEPEAVSFETVDEVELHGKFYPSEQGIKAPCALLIHNIGGNSAQDGWEDLARSMQKNGYAVLTFDLRGHGESTKVSPAFWKVSASQLIKGGMANAKKKEVHYKDFLPAYLPNLVNDIAAARRFLDTKNDDKKCNSANIVVIAAQESATLAGLWLAAEWSRRPPRMAGGNAPQPFGQDIVACIWLSFTPTLGKTLVKPGKYLSPQRDRTPMYFLFGEDDKRTATFADDLCNKILKVDTPPRPKDTGHKGIKSKGVGNELLQKSLGTDELIIKYVKKVMEDRPDQPWADRDLKRVKFDFVNVKTFLQ